MGFEVFGGVEERPSWWARPGPDPRRQLKRRKREIAKLTSRPIRARGRLVTETLIRAAESIKDVLVEPKPTVQFVLFGDWSLDFRLLVWTNRPRRHPQIKSDINYRIRQLFNERGIEIPFPQRELRVRGGALQVGNQGDDQEAASPAAAAREETFSAR